MLNTKHIDIRYTPLPKQHGFLKSNSHFLAFIAGIGSGKTLTGIHRDIRAAFGQIGTERIPTPNTGMVCAPTYDMINLILIPEYIQILGFVEQGGLIESYNKSEKTMILVNGSKIVFRSTEYPDRLRGPNLSWVHLDEAALMGSAVWDIVFGRIRQSGNFGYIWITTTPAGRNWIYQKWVQDSSMRYQLIRMHTFENIFLHPEFLQALAEEYTGDFAGQELGGKFVAFKGLIYPEFSPDRHVFHEMPDINHYHQRIAGVDWGYDSPGVILVFGIDGDGRMDLLHEEYARRRGIDDWASVARQLQDTYRISSFYCDPSKPDYIQKLVDAGTNALAADNTVSTGIQEVRNKLVKRDEFNVPYFRVHSSAVWMQKEFSQYQWLTKKIRGEGEVSMDVPRKSNDHAMDAGRYAVNALRSTGNYFDISVDVLTRH